VRLADCLAKIFKEIKELDVITLTKKWNSGCCIFPVGTVFIPQRTTRSGGTVYAYGTPGGGHGECLIDAGVTPGN
jgi:hypothetical protein